MLSTAVNSPYEETDDPVEIDADQFFKQRQFQVKDIQITKPMVMNSNRMSEVARARVPLLFETAGH